MYCKYCKSPMIHATRYGYFGAAHFYRCPNCHSETNKIRLLSFGKTKAENIIREGDNTVQRIYNDFTRFA